jgi:hypothetical protein
MTSKKGVSILILCVEMYEDDPQSNREKTGVIEK